jgi:integrase
VTRLSGGPPRAKGHGGPPTDGAGRLQLRASADIDFDARHAHRDMTKNGNERDVPLSKAAMTLLRIVKKRKPMAPVVPVQTGRPRISVLLARPSIHAVNPLRRRRSARG